jgi:hypothetical protein
LPQPLKSSEAAGSAEAATVNSSYGVESPEAVRLLANSLKLYYTQIYLLFPLETADLNPFFAHAGFIFNRRDSSKSPSSLKTLSQSALEPGTVKTSKAICERAGYSVLKSSQYWMGILLVSDPVAKNLSASNAQIHQYHQLSIKWMI